MLLPNSSTQSLHSPHSSWQRSCHLIPPPPASRSVSFTAQLTASTATMLTKVVGTNVCVRSALRLAVAVVAVCLALMPLPSASLPLNDIIGEASAQARREHQLVKRAATLCERPSNLEQMFQALNSQVNIAIHLLSMHVTRTWTFSSSHRPSVCFLYPRNFCEKGWGWGKIDLKNGRFA